MIKKKEEKQKKKRNELRARTLRDTDGENHDERVKYYTRYLSLTALSRVINTPLDSTHRRDPRGPLELVFPFGLVLLPQHLSGNRTWIPISRYCLANECDRELQCRELLRDWSYLPETRVQCL